MEISDRMTPTITRVMIMGGNHASRHKGRSPLFMSVTGINSAAKAFAPTCMAANEEAVKAGGRAHDGIG